MGSENKEQFSPILIRALKDCAADFLVAILFLSNFTPEIRKEGFMKRSCLIGLLAILLSPCYAQQIIFSSLDDLLTEKGDTVTTLVVEKRSINNLYMSNGADYRITSEGNSGLSKFIKNRTYAVQMGDDLYVNCKFVHYNHYHFGNWYAKAHRVKGNIYFAAQPYGQRASSNVKSEGTTKLGGSVGNAIAASGLVRERVFYVINPETKRAELVTSDLVCNLLADTPELLASYQTEESESAEVVEKYLVQLQRKQ